MSRSLLSFHDVTLKRGKNIIFQNLNFTLKQGEHWAITGAGGSGKSMLLEAIAGKIAISAGETDHLLLDEYVEQRKEKQVLFGWHQLIELVTSKHAFKNLSNTSTFYYQQRFNSADSDDAETVEEYLSGLNAFDAQAIWTLNKVMQKFNLSGLKDKHLIKLSNGETKRLLLAAALIKNPVILLLDDPFVGLDVQTRKKLNEWISEIAASGITIVMTTTVTEIPDAITHIATIENGSLHAVERKKFNPENHLLTSTLEGIDKKELKSLLTYSETEAYEVLVKMEEVVISYDGKRILDEVSWLVKPNEHWALTGHNGAGKSTLLSLINGDNPQAYANKIVLFDKKKGSGESIWDIKQKIGFVSPELYQYFPTDHSCVEVIESGFYDTPGLFRKSVPVNVQLIKRWMKVFGLQDYSQELFRNTATSLQRMCLLIRALIKNPALLILDEPCQGVDAKQQEQFKQVINLLCDNSAVSIIYVSHYEEQLPTCIDHWLKLEKGRVVRN